MYYKLNIKICCRNLKCLPFFLWIVVLINVICSENFKCPSFDLCKHKSGQPLNLKILIPIFKVEVIKHIKTLKDCLEQALTFPSV